MPANFEANVGRSSIAPSSTTSQPTIVMSQAKEVRRATIDGQLWLEMEMLPPHAMAGSKYYASPASCPSGGLSDGVCASSPCFDLLVPAASELTVAQLPDALESLLQHHNLIVRA